MKIKTKVLQEMMDKAIKGASFNKLIPITSLIGIYLSNGKLTLMTTDGSNQVRITEKVEVDLDPMKTPISTFYTIVNADTFSKLVSKTTKEFISLENQENFLEIKGNGIYKLEIPINEDGEIIKFPTYEFDLQNAKSKEISVKELQNILLTAQTSVAKTMEIPCLTGYYLSNENIIATDRQMVSNIKTSLVDEPILISAEMANLIQILDTEKVTLSKEENKLLFTTDTVTIYGKELEGKEIYPIEPVLNLSNVEYDKYTKVNKQDLLDVLDRMALFVSDYDKNGVYLKFTKDSLSITSQKSNAEEIIKAESSSDSEFTCLIDIEMLKSQVQNITTDTITIYYGQDTSIKLQEGNVLTIISLLQKND